MNIKPEYANLKINEEMANHKSSLKRTARMLQIKGMKMN